MAEFRNNRALAVSFVALVIGVHAWGIIPDVDDYSKEPPDFYFFLLKHVASCDPYDLPYLHDSPISARNQIKWYANCLSWTWFENPKVIPIIFNIGVMPLVYLIASSMTRNRLIGIIALVAFINNPLYTDWEGNGTYDQTWSFFLLLSVWLMYKGGGSAIPYGLSILTKGLALMYMPAIIYTSYKIRKSRIEIGIIIGIGITVTLLALQYSNMVGNEIGFFPERWEDAIFRNISVLWQVIPFVALFVVLKTNFTPKLGRVPNMDIVWVWIGMALIQNPLISFFTLQDTYSYRYVPLAAFMSIFMGMVLVNLGNWIVEQKLKRASLPSI